MTVDQVSSWNGRGRGSSILVGVGLGSTKELGLEEHPEIGVKQLEGLHVSARLAAAPESRRAN